MLLAVAEGGGGEEDTFRQARLIHGAPALHRSSPGWMLAGWGRAVSNGIDAHWMFEGAFTRPPRGGDGALFERVVVAAGDFALLGADERGIVLASGTAGGYRPIYLATPRPGQIIVCTSMDLMCRLLPERPALDADALAGRAAAVAMFQSAERSNDASLFQGIRRLPPYEAWHVTVEGRIRKADTFRPAAIKHAPNERDFASELRHALSSTVARAMEGHERVGVLVSGGVDSSSLLGIAHDLNRPNPARAKIDVYTWDYRAYHGDDRPHFDSLVRYLNIEAHRTTPTEAAEAVGATFVQDGMPYHGWGGPYLVALSKSLRASGATVLLTGVAGDDVLDGRPTLLSDLAGSGHPLKAVAMAARLRGPFMGDARWRVWHYVLRPLLRQLVPLSRTIRRRRRHQVMDRRYPWAGPRLRRKLREIADTSFGPDPRLDWSARERFEALARSPLVRECCGYRAQEEHIVGCLRRDPYLDEELLRTVASFPPLALLDGNFRRGLLRSSVRGLVPDTVRLRETKAVMDPAFGQMLAAAGGAKLLEPLADVRMLADLGIAEPRLFRRAFDDWALDVERGAWILVWPVLAVESFLRQWDSRTA